MNKHEPFLRLTPRLITALYSEALLLMDESRSYFESDRLSDSGTLTPVDRISLACESLKVTTRLMHIIAWLMARRASRADLVSPGDGQGGRISPLGKASPSDAAQVERLPEQAQHLIRASMDLYKRVRRIDEGSDDALMFAAAASPARGLIDRLSQVY